MSASSPTTQTPEATGKNLRREKAKRPPHAPTTGDQRMPSHYHVLNERYTRALLQGRPLHPTL
ncbi:uncharacterized protein BDZ99DRAFT_463409 [Mytilinidion resinicola]|uniref:Uncharacterized protein n=1 Tax=Mytilinidion resinicola TaxID=574789 RepID=A0A6A6YNS0_9PEZI|nr:uncharacterized protein BDZ99DRAFT_463409 [Mytilinidion resinicola]KAF2809625.1 hypothetical protein BDZ99DRAFT_463409 [Mytilinidion resinicola]